MKGNDYEFDYDDDNRTRSGCHPGSGYRNKPGSHAEYPRINHLYRKPVICTNRQIRQYRCGAPDSNLHAASYHYDNRAALAEAA